MLEVDFPNQTDVNEVNEIGTAGNTVLTVES